MPNSILHKRSSTAGVVPHAALLANGEIALNSADGTWFIKKTDGTVLDLRQPLIADGGAQPLAGINADAQDWQTRVIAAGGTVSVSTFTAVNNFCNAIDAAGIRDRFYRLNLFCGGNLAAALVPLYRGPSFSGTQYGNSIDTNSNFVAGDYAETGATGGLNNSSNKSLNTGLSPDTMISAASGHLAYYGAQWTPTTTINPGSVVIGAISPDATNRVYILGRGNTPTCGGSTAIIGAQLGTVGAGSQCSSDNNVSAGFYVASRTTTTRSDFYRDASMIGFWTATNSYSNFSDTLRVFTASQNGATTVGFAVMRLQAYSAGVGMTAAQVAAFNSAMQAFQIALGRVPPTVSNADAQDWVNRVYAAGGTVSQSTATAVSNFCATIDAAGLRDRFYRLNLFCGNELTACLVPLYRGQSLGGTQFGNTTDTNIAFTSADYAETGATGGLLGNGSSKYLQTGLTTAALPTLATGHLSAYTINAYGSLVSSFSAGFDGTSFYGLGSSSSLTSRFSWGGIHALAPTVANDLSTGVISLARTNTTTSKAYKNGTQIGTTDTATITPVANNGGGFSVFASMAEVGNVISFLSGRLGAYSIGSGMTDAQMLAYSNALRTFQAALNRLVAPLVANSDAQDWIDRVYLAGGTVSQSTAAAVNTFCNSINATGLRDRFYRLNLFCGNDLTACRVPLYRGPSLSGAQYGNATDTNSNFVASDYVETGLNGGLRGGANKTLATGVPINFSSATNTHLAVYESVVTTGNDRALIGVDTNPTMPRTIYVLYHLNSAQTTYYDGTDSSTPFIAGERLPGFYIGSNQASRRDLFVNGLTFGFVNGAKTITGTQTTPNFTVFGFGGTTVTGFHNGKLNGYSLGYGLDATQSRVYYEIMQTFQTALRRNV